MDPYVLRDADAGRLVNVESVVEAGRRRAGELRRQSGVFEVIRGERLSALGERKPSGMERTVAVIIG
ncbi:hypothetical protein BRD03_13405 [Halobacteriales archaeon QS_9_68_17]|nr:MAG: hypothetical protein BRD03_13405 [Halobacteriales archaeon QS_9_68_17]